MSDSRLHPAAALATAAETIGEIRALQLAAAVGPGRAEGVPRRCRYEYAGSLVCAAFMSLRRLAHLTLVVLGLITAVSAYYVAQLRFNYNFNDFYPAGDPDLDYYQGYTQRFGNDNDYLLLGLEAPAGKTVFDPAFLAPRRFAHAAGPAAAPRGGKSPRPPPSANPVVEGLGVFNLPYLHPNEPARRAADSTLIYRTPGLVGNVFSPDARAVALVLQITPDLKKPPGDSLFAELRGGLTRLGFAESRCTSRASWWRSRCLWTGLKWEMVVFMSLSVLLVTGLLWLTFRTWWGVVLPLVVVLGAILWGLGLMAACGVSIDLMTALLPLMLFVVGMSDTIHIISRYVSELGYGASKKDALRITIKESGFGSGLSALTTSLGFFTLMTSTIRPIHNFGLFTGIAVILAFRAQLHAAAGHAGAAGQARSCASPAARATAGTACWAVCFARCCVRRRLVFTRERAGAGRGLGFATRVRINSALLDDLSKGDPVRQDFAFFERQFAGVRPFELELKPAAGRDIYDLAVLRQTEQIEHYLARTYGLRFAASPVTLVKSVRKALNGGGLAEYRLPTDAGAATPARQAPPVPQEARIQRPGPARWLGRPPHRPHGRRGQHPGRRAQRSLRRFLRTGIDTTVLRTRLTGSSNLIDKNNENLTLNMIQGMAIDVAMVTLIVLALFKSVRMTVVVLIPNLLPIVIVAGVMGVAGVNMKVSTSIIFTIAFGIAVDDTIHFITKLRLTLGQGARHFPGRAPHLPAGRQGRHHDLADSGGRLLHVAVFEVRRHFLRRFAHRPDAAVRRGGRADAAAVADSVFLSSAQTGSETARATS